jgi:hypothetical protein
MENVAACPALGKQNKLKEQTSGARGLRWRR